MNPADPYYTGALPDILTWVVSAGVCILLGIGATRIGKKK